MGVVRLDLAYDGTGFRGYARQAGQRTVQGEIESALHQIFARDLATSVAGRTDAGVHALHQVVSFELDGVSIDNERIVRSLNSMLGGEIVVSACSQAPDDFSARFSAKGRTYRYIVNTSGLVNPMVRHTEWTVGNSIDPDLLGAAAARFVGEHDFTSFCRSVEGKSNIRRVELAKWEDVGEGRWAFWITANAFCHQMVRSLVGTCYDVARGHVGINSVQEIMERRNRSTMGTVAPPHGLTLWKVDY